jgi:hypothetical protein
LNHDSTINVHDIEKDFMKMNMNDEQDQGLPLEKDVEAPDVRYINLATMHGEGEDVGTSTSTNRTSPLSSYLSEEHSSPSFSYKEPSTSPSSIHPTPYTLFKSTPNETKKYPDDFVNIEDGYHDDSNTPIPVAEVTEKKGIDTTKENGKTDKKDVKVVGNNLKDVCVSKSISQVMHFKDAAAPIGVCKEKALAALSSLLDSSYTDCIEALGITGSPQVMLGPVLEAVGDWILKPSDQGYDGNSYGCSSSAKDDRKNGISGQIDRGVKGNTGTDKRVLSDRPQGLAGLVIGALINAGPYLSVVIVLLCFVIIYR